MPLPKKYHAATFMGLLVMLLLLGLYLLSGGYSQVADSQTAESRAAALARNATHQQLQLPSSSNNVFSSQQQYRHPIVYDKLTGATNNQINDVLGASKQQPTLISEYPIDHYQQQQQQQQQPPQFHHPSQNLLADQQQQQRHRQQMLDRQMLFGAPNPFGPHQHQHPPPLPPPPPPMQIDFPQNDTTNPNYYPDTALYRQQQQPPSSSSSSPPPSQQQDRLPPMMPPFPLPPSPPPPPPPSSSQSQQQQQQPTTSTSNNINQAPIRPPYAHLAPSMNMPPMSQYEQQPPAHHQQQLKPAAAQSRLIPLNSRIDPTTTPTASVAPPPAAPSQQQQQQQQLHSQQPQMVLASNQAPPKTLNSILPPPPIQSLNGGGGGRLVASSSAAPVCVRQQLDQQQQQVPTDNSANGNSSVSRVQMPILFCNIDPEYPTKEIMRALELYAQEQRTIETLLPQLLIQLHIQAQPARQPGGNHQLLTLDQLQSSLLSASPWQSNNTSSSGGQSSLDKQFPSANFEQMCRSTIQMAQPRRAKNLAGQWKVVVNLPGHKYRGVAISQMVRIEECSAPLSECATPTKPSAGLAKSSCLQHYDNQRLVAWTPQQGLHIDMFRVPVACSCHIRRS